MKRILLTLLTALLPLLAFAGGEQDFAARFIQLYGQDYRITCTTVSPLMMERMLQLPDVEASGTTRQVLSQLKSIRMVQSTSPAEVPHLYANATRLARRNPNRYKLYAEESGKRLYVRRRPSGLIVEMVLFMEQRHSFSLINLTGNISDSFIDQLMRL